MSIAKLAQLDPCELFDCFDDCNEASEAEIAYILGVESAIADSEDLSEFYNN